jgi:hypothetical protein
MSGFSKSRISKAIFGTLAISVACGAVQLAFGHDLTGRQQVASMAPETGVNRAAKADRAAVSSLGGQSRTIALRLDGLADTSVLIRMPLTKGEAAKGEARNRPAPAPVTRPGDRKTTVACEPVVSVLTEVAKLLQPGRCVT